MEASVTINSDSRISLISGSRLSLVHMTVKNDS
jgi:hypothetical protein